MPTTSTLNSTVTPLGLGTQFRGIYEEVIPFSSVQVMIYSDVPSTTDGLRFVWSDDGITDRVTDHVYTYRTTDDEGNPYTSAQVINPEIRGKWLLVEFNKSALLNQTAFVIATVLREGTLMPPTRRLSRQLQDDDQGLLTSTQVSRGFRTQISTSTPLGVGATFATGVQGGRDFNRLMVTVFADQDSAADGLEIRFYGNNTQVDHTIRRTYVAADGMAPLVVPMLGRNFSVHYTNGGTLQGTFRLNIFRMVLGESNTYSLGQPGDGAWDGTGDANVTQILKRLVDGGPLEHSGADSLTANLDFVEIDCAGRSSLAVTFTGTHTAGRVDFTSSVDAFVTEESVPGYWMGGADSLRFSMPFSIFYTGITFLFNVANLDKLRLTARGSFSGTLLATYRLGSAGATVVVGTAWGTNVDEAAQGDAPGTINAHLRGVTRAIGADSDTAATTDSGTFSLLAFVKRLLAKFTTQFPAALTASGNFKVALAETETALSFPLDQGAAGTTLIAAASASNKHKIVGGLLTLDAAGTVKFTDGVGDLTGAMTLDANSGFVIPAEGLPMIETSTTNTALSLVTTGGKAKGVIRYRTEP